VIANQAPGWVPVPFVRKTIGAMHGVGSARSASIFASPAVVAGVGSVTRLTPVVGEAGVRQLTTPRKAEMGFTPLPTPEALRGPLRSRDDDSAGDGSAMKLANAMRGSE
jgi:hypothetical protein